MAYFAMLWKAQTIEKYRLKYESEKTNSILISKRQIPKQSLSQRWRHYRCDTQKKISTTFKKLYPDGSTMSNFFVYLKTDQTFPNFVIKSFVGFVGGVILTYLCFIFFVFQLSISLIHATIMSSIIGVLLTLGLAFSYRIRCLVFLLIPQCFSRVGRYTLTCYALVLILTGPATNTLKNSEVLSESLACSQEQIKTSVRTLNLMTTKPLNNLKDSIQPMVEKLRSTASKVKDMFLKINRLILSIADVIDTNYQWLRYLSNTWNNKLGTPYSKCVQLIQNGVQSCKKEFPFNQSTLCSTVEAINKVCSNMSQDVACMWMDPVGANIAPVIRKRLANFSDRLRHMLFMQVDVHHTYSYSSNTTRTANQVAAGIVTEIRKRADPLLTWLSWCSCVTSLFLCLIVFRAKSYQHMFETRSRFDNRYITKEIRILDLKRLREGRETILPLNRRERAKYVTTTSFRLVASEKAFLNRSIVFMTITTFKLLIHMAADYSLYWVLMTIRYHGRLQSLIEPGSLTATAHISGSGPTADLLKAIVSSLAVLIESPVFTPVSCLPNPHPPDFRRYSQIVVLILLLWFVAICEPYGLRLRHVVMGHYQPDRAKARALWIYNHILRTRGSFMKFARRKLHRTYKYRPEERLTFRKWLDDRMPFCWLRSFLGTKADEPRCLLCGTVYYKHRSDTLIIRCKSPNCPGVYCTCCFTDIGELCTVCLSPEDYGDFSDVSLERGTSDESDTDDDTISKRRHNCSTFDHCESGENIDHAVSKDSRGNRKCRFSTDQKRNSNEIPLLRRKIIQRSIEQNKEKDQIVVTENFNKSITKKVSTVKATNRGEYMSHLRYREECITRCKFCDDNVNVCGIITTEQSGQIRASSSNPSITSKPSISRRKPKRNKKNHNGRKMLKKAGARNTNMRFSNVNSFRITKEHAHKSVKLFSSFTQLINRTTQYSFYNVSFSKNSMSIDKIKLRTSLRRFLKKQFHSTRKFKMRRRCTRCVCLTNLRRNNTKIANSFKTKRKICNKAIVLCSCKGDCQINFNTVITDEECNKLGMKIGHRKELTETEGSSCCLFRKLCMLFSDFWKNISKKVTLNTNDSSSKTGDNLVAKKIKNRIHRKKKTHKSKNPTSLSRKTQRDNEEIRNSRILAYLTEQEWRKKQSGNKPKMENERIERNMEISDPLIDLENVPRKQNKLKWGNLNLVKKSPKCDMVVKKCSVFDQCKIIKAVDGQRNLCAEKDAETETSVKTKEISIDAMKSSKNILLKIKSGFVNVFKCPKKTLYDNKHLSKGHQNPMADMQNALNILVEDFRKTLKDPCSQIDNTKRVGKTCTCATQYDRFVDEKRRQGIYQHISRNCSVTNGDSSSIRSDTSSCADDTNCSLSYLNDQSSKSESRRTKVATKNNQIDKPQLCDVSTTTSDWWSPLVERRNIYKNRKVKMEREFDEEEKYIAKNRTSRNDGKLVKFKTQAQIIPAVTKYYNELFSSQYYAHIPLI